jgi:putative heme-binding domain-containing protein
MVFVATFIATFTATFRKMSKLHGAQRAQIPHLFVCSLSSKKWGMQFKSFCSALVLVMALPCAQAASAEAPADADRTPVAVEALLRLEAVDLEANPALKGAVLRVLGSVRGTPHFVAIVKKFKLRDQNDGLLEVALKHPGNEAGVEAVRTLLSTGGATLLEQTLQTAAPDAARSLIQALGNAGGKAPVALLLPRVQDEAGDLVLRREGVRALAKTQDGAQAILRLAAENALPEDVLFLAGSELHSSRWPQIKEEAGRLLPLPQSRDAQSLPPLPELLKLKGNAANGARLYRRQETGCVQCHKVNGEGIEIGPDLSEIGSKLGREALIESILDPNAGISFGYEAWQMELKNGDEPYGLIVSDTADEVALKDLQGIITRHKKSEIVKRDRMKLSIMPSGLQQTLSTQEFVDLIEYLASLKKAGG